MSRDCPPSFLPSLQIAGVDGQMDGQRGVFAFGTVAAVGDRFWLVGPLQPACRQGSTRPPSSRPARECQRCGA